MSPSHHLTCRCYTTLQPAILPPQNTQIPLRSSHPRRLAQATNKTGNKLTVHVPPTISKKTRPSPTRTTSSESTTETPGKPQQIGMYADTGKTDNPSKNLQEGMLVLHIFMCIRGHCTLLVGIVALSDQFQS